MQLKWGENDRFKDNFFLNEIINFLNVLRINSCGSELS